MTCAVFFLSFIFATPFLAAGPVYDKSHGKEAGNNLNRSSLRGNTSFLPYFYSNDTEDENINGNPGHLRGDFALERISNHTDNENHDESGNR